MKTIKGWGATVFALAAATLLVHPAQAQKQGGILKSYVWDTPPSASVATCSPRRAMPRRPT